MTAAEWMKLYQESVATARLRERDYLDASIDPSERTSATAVVVSTVPRTRSLDTAMVGAAAHSRSSGALVTSMLSEEEAVVLGSRCAVPVIDHATVQTHDRVRAASTVSTVSKIDKEKESKGEKGKGTGVSKGVVHVMTATIIEEYYTAPLVPVRPVPLSALPGPVVRPPSPEYEARWLPQYEYGAGASGEEDDGFECYSDEEEVEEEEVVVEREEDEVAESAEESTWDRDSAEDFPTTDLENALPLLSLDPIPAPPPVHTHTLPSTDKMSSPVFGGISEDLVQNIDSDDDLSIKSATSESNTVEDENVWGNRNHAATEMTLLNMNDEDDDNNEGDEYVGEGRSVAHSEVENEVVTDIIGFDLWEQKSTDENDLIGEREREREDTVIGLDSNLNNLNALYCATDTYDMEDFISGSNKCDTNYYDGYGFDTSNQGDKDYTNNNYINYDFNISDDNSDSSEASEHSEGRSKFKPDFDFDFDFNELNSDFRDEKKGDYASRLVSSVINVANWQTKKNKVSDSIFGFEGFSSLMQSANAQKVVHEDQELRTYGHSARGTGAGLAESDGDVSSSNMNPILSNMAREKFQFAEIDFYNQDAEYFDNISQNVEGMRGQSLNAEYRIEEWGKSDSIKTSPLVHAPSPSDLFFEECSSSPDADVANIPGSESTDFPLDFYDNLPDLRAISDGRDEDHFKGLGGLDIGEETGGGDFKAEGEVEAEMDIEMDTEAETMMEAENSSFESMEEEGAVRAREQHTASRPLNIFENEDSPVSCDFQSLCGDKAEQVVEDEVEEEVEDDCHIPYEANEEVIEDILARDFEFEWNQNEVVEEGTSCPDVLSRIGEADGGRGSRLDDILRSSLGGEDDTEGSGKYEDDFESGEATPSTMSSNPFSPLQSTGSSLLPVTPPIPPFSHPASEPLPPSFTFPGSPPLSLPLSLSATLPVTQPFCFSVPPSLPSVIPPPLPFSFGLPVPSPTPQPSSTPQPFCFSVPPALPYSSSTQSTAPIFSFGISPPAPALSTSLLSFSMPPPPPATSSSASFPFEFGPPLNSPPMDEELSVPVPLRDEVIQSIIDFPSAVQSPLSLPVAAPVASTTVPLALITDNSRGAASSPFQTQDQGLGPSLSTSGPGSKGKPLSEQKAQWFVNPSDIEVRRSPGPYSAVYAPQLPPSPTAVSHRFLFYSDTLPPLPF